MISMCLNHLDEIDDVLDYFDETAGIPTNVSDAWNTLWDYFMELSKLNFKEN